MLYEINYFDKVTKHKSTSSLTKTVVEVIDNHLLNFAFTDSELLTLLDEIPMFKTFASFGLDNPTQGQILESFKELCCQEYGSDSFNDFEKFLYRNGWELTCELAYAKVSLHVYDEFDNEVVEIIMDRDYGDEYYYMNGYDKLIDPVKEQLDDMLNNTDFSFVYDM